MKMMRLLVLLSCLGVIYGSHSPLRDAVSSQGTERVVGGTDAPPNYWRWQVSLQYGEPYDETSFYHICGGTLISINFVMTAGHCILSPQSTNFRVVLGEYNLYIQEGTEIVLPVERIFLHPQWTGDLGNGNDIALLKLASPIYDNGFIEIAQLPEYEQFLPNGYTCYITGWGLTQSGGSSPAILQEAPLPIVEHSICSRSDWWGSLAKKTMLCAGGDGNIAGCQGDSGGPLNCYMNGYWQVHGVVSYGPSGMCNAYKKPTVFTRVSSYLGWISSIIRYT
uniref:Elastase-1-like n=2 Tax=Lepisosteus oculatus TaxID=7918 RepID=W5MUM3_LEPOC